MGRTRSTVQGVESRLKTVENENIQLKSENASLQDHNGQLLAYSQQTQAYALQVERECDTFKARALKAEQERNFRRCKRTWRRRSIRTRLRRRLYRLHVNLFVSNSCPKGPL